MEGVLCAGLDSLGGTPGTSRSLARLAVVNPRVQVSLQKGCVDRAGIPQERGRPRGEPLLAALN